MGFRQVYECIPVFYWKRERETRQRRYLDVKSHCVETNLLQPSKLD
jgi:hypothetical protein